MYVKECSARTLLRPLYLANLLNICGANADLGGTVK